MLPSSSATVTRKPFAAPVEVDCNARRAPLASVTTEALTPPLAALIAAATPASVSCEAPIGTVMAEPVPGVKTVLPAFQLPSWIVRLPVPTTLVPSVYWPVGLTTDCPADRVDTETE